MYFNSIQLLRCIAALYVTLFHISYWWNQNNDALAGAFKNGHAGIDLFFVISGFVVVQSASKFKPGIASCIQFLKKRFIRIYPVYWLFLLLFFITGMLGTAQRTGWQIGQAVFLLPGHRGLIRSSWTLQYEVYFYLLIGVWVLSRKGKYILGALFLMALISFSATVLAAVTSIGHFPVLGIYNEFVLEFFSGVLIFMIYKKIPVAAAVLLSIAGLLLFFVPVQLVSSHVIAFGIPSAMLLAASTALEYRRKIKIPRIAVLLGDASYCLYLIHPPLITFVLTKIPDAYSSNKLMLCFFIVALCALAVVVHWYLEKPLLRYLNNNLNKSPVPEKTKEEVLP